jgi:potassium inwardly-rectifying channel subfamily J
MARPKGRAETVIFSRKAVVNRDPRDGVMTLAFRVGDMRSSQLIGVSIDALLVDKGHVSGSRGCIELCQQRLKIATEFGDDLFLLVWPMTIVHRIDEQSPLWELSPEALLLANFEIVIVLEASSEATGATTQVLGPPT